MIDSPTFRTDEKFLSQLPALELLAKMGWQPLTPAQANAKRRGASAVLLEDITREFLRGQTLTLGDATAKLSDDHIDNIIRRLKKLPQDTFGKKAQNVWELLTLPQSVEVSANGRKRNFNFKFIDFDKWQNNFFHLVPELEVQRQRSNKTRRPDIVLFVNGIPLAVLENKAPNVDVAEGVSQTIRNQKREEIPNLYVYAQVLLSLNKNDNRYGTTGTPAKLWSKWRRGELTEADIAKIIAAPLSQGAQSAIAEGLSLPPNALPQGAAREVMDQDYALAGLCKPERLLRMTRNFILFSGPTKIIARFQQVGAIQKTLARVGAGGKGEPREGGVIWHTQGSGKSLTMVLLARALVGEGEFNNARIVLVTDRVDLDKQIKGTFQNASMEPKRANTGKELAQLVNNKQAGVITTIINKFENAVREGAKDESRDVFVLVDEAHRTQYGNQHAQMRRAFPNACFLGFTGTPISQKSRNTMGKFGGLIDTYTMQDAVKDGAVVRLIYDGRMTTPKMNKKEIDAWFKRKMEDLTEEQKADLNKKFARAKMISQLDQVIERRAEDISNHYRDNFQHTGLKGQLVAPSKKAAIKYKKELEQIGAVSCEVLISSPDTRGGHEEVDEGEADDAVVAFWEQMMRRWGDETRYNEGVISQFKNDDNPEIIIVVSKLLTGFDSPRNTVLYLTKNFNEGATLLQAVARVNRVLDSEEKGYKANKNAGFVIDYEGVLENLDKAVAEYETLAGYDKDEIAEIFPPAKIAGGDVPQKHAALLDVFKPLDKNADQEAYQRFLADQKTREDFYEAFADFAAALRNALATARFYDETPEAKIRQYKEDLERFAKLRAVVRVLCGEKVDFKKYEKELERTLHRNISAAEIEQVVEAIDIFGLPQSKLEEIARQHKKAAAAMAEKIASKTKRTLHENMDKNPALCAELTERLQKIINDFINKRLAEMEFFRRVTEIREQAERGDKPQTPAAIKDKPLAAAFYKHLTNESPLSKKEGGFAAAVDLAAFFDDCLQRHKTVEMFKRDDVIKQVRRELVNFIYEALMDKGKIDLTEKEIDEIEGDLLFAAKRGMGQ